MWFRRSSFLRNKVVSSSSSATLLPVPGSTLRNRRPFSTVTTKAINTAATQSEEQVVLRFGRQLNGAFIVSSTCTIAATAITFAALSLKQTNHQLQDITSCHSNFNYASHGFTTDFAKPPIVEKIGAVAGLQHVDAVSSPSEGYHIKKPKFHRTKRSIIAHWLYLFWTSLKIMFRLLQLSIIFMPTFIVAPFAYMLPSVSFVQSAFRFSLIHSLQFGGPMFIKLGQWASTRADLFDDDVRATLSLLHSNSKGQKQWHTEQTLKTALQIKNLEQVFEEFDFNPVGVGVIGLVFKARVKNGNKKVMLNSKIGTNEVAVKVRRFKVDRQINLDLTVLNAFARIINLLIPHNAKPFNIQGACDQFSAFMVSQLDFNQEGRNLERFTKNFIRGSSKDPWAEEIRFPEPLFCSDDGAVLIETFEPGEILSKLLKDYHEDKNGTSLLCNDQVRKRAARLGLNALLKMILVDNFTHSDLHPGNMLLRSHKNENGQPVLDGITFIDAGLVTELNDVDQDNFLDLFAAVALGDGRKAGKLMIERSRPEDILATEEEQEQFIEGMADVVSKVSKTTFVLDKVKIGEVLQQVLSLVHHYRIPIEPNFSSMVLSLVVAEGILRQLDGELDIFKLSMPFLIRANTKWWLAGWKQVFKKTFEFLGGRLDED